MICKKKGNKCDEIFTGSCCTCGSEFEAKKSEIKNINYLTDRIEYGFKKCTQCNKGFIHFSNVRSVI